MGKRYSHLSCEDRTLIQLSLERKCSMSEIGRSLERPTSTIIRELKRNGWKKKQSRQRGRPPIAGGYRAVIAHQQAKERSIKGRKPKRLIEGSVLWNSVDTLLREFKSPEQIAGMLKRIYPDDKGLQVSHETIYTAIYAMPRGVLRKDLIACLRQSRKSRRPRARGNDRRGKIPNMVSIHERPAEIEDRLVPGHWEGDLIKGAKNASSVGTLVERTSLFVTLVKMDSAGALDAQKGFAHVLNRMGAKHQAKKNLELQMPCRKIHA